MSGWEIAILVGLCVAFAVAVGFTVYAKLKGKSCCDGCDGCCDACRKGCAACEKERDSAGAKDGDKID